MLYDAHNHIQHTAPAVRIPELLQRAKEAGVGRMTTCATGARGDWEALLAIDDSHREVVSVAIGLHPWQVEATHIDWKSRMEKILDERPFSIGEIGLDKGESCECPIEEQIRAFEWQLDLALERNLPVTIHCVAAWDLLSEALLGRPKLRYLMHDYHASPEVTAALAKRGAYFSLGPASFGVHAKPIETALVKIPADRLLLETDSPDARFPRNMSPEKPNEPARARDICERLAKALGKEPAEVEKSTADNAVRFFGIGS